MAEGPKPVRRVVTGNDEHGRSKVVWDSAAPNPQSRVNGAGMTDIWVYQSCPALLSGTQDLGNLPFNFEPPAGGGYMRIVQTMPPPPDYDPAKDKLAVPAHPPRREPGGTWSRGDQNAYSSRIHKTKTVDYGIVMAGERILQLDHGECLVKPGVIVVQVGDWHRWVTSRVMCQVALVMMDATFEDPRFDG